MRQAAHDNVGSARLMHGRGGRPPLQRVSVDCSSSYVRLPGAN
jgi:hypothetical protein